MSETTFRKDLRYIVRSLWEGVLTQSQFENQMERILERELSNAWAEGASECGISNDDYTTEEEAALRIFIDVQITYISGFADAVVESNKKSGERIFPLFERTKLWLNRYQEAKNQAKTMACKNQKLEWVTGLRGCKEHCGDCSMYNGKVYRASIWERYDIRPQHRGLGCGGFRCCCGFRTTDRAVNKGRPPMMRGR